MTKGHSGGSRIFRRTGSQHRRRGANIGGGEANIGGGAPTPDEAMCMSK